MLLSEKVIPLTNRNITKNNALVCGFTFPSPVSSSPPHSPNDSSSISRNDSFTTYCDESNSSCSSLSSNPILYSSDSHSSSSSVQSQSPEACSSPSNTTDNTPTELFLSTIRQVCKPLSTIKSGIPLHNEDNDNNISIFESYDRKENQQQPIISINSPHRSNYFIHSITNFQLSALLNGSEGNKHFWNSIAIERYPNLLNHEFLATLKGQYLFEIALSQIGCYDSRFFGCDESLWLYRQIVFGPSNFRKAAAKTLYNRLLEKEEEAKRELEINKEECTSNNHYIQDEYECKEEYDDQYNMKKKEKRPKRRREEDDEEESKTRSIAAAVSVQCISKLQWEVPLTQIADIIVRIFGDSMINLFLQDSGCFLAEHLWKICSDHMKLYLCELLIIQNCILLATDPKGNYIISAIIEWLHYQLKVNDKNYNALLVCWQWAVNWIARDISTFVKLCKDKYGIYVVKNFVKYCDIDVQIYLLNELTRHALIPQLKKHSQAKYVVKNLTFSCCHYNRRFQFND